MRRILFLAIIVAGCNTANDNQTNEFPAGIHDTVPKTDNTTVREFAADSALPKTFKQSNERFREVSVEKISPDSARVRGSARIFEANLSYAIYHKGSQVYEGYHTTSAGAPEWGTFDFNIAIPRSSGHAETYLILFESSAKDGSRLGILKFPL